MKVLTDDEEVKAVEEMKCREWAGKYGRCPWCRADKSEGHAEKCPLAVAMALYLPCKEE